MSISWFKWLLKSLYERESSGFENKPKIKKDEKDFRVWLLFYIEMVVASKVSKTTSSFAVLQNKVDEALTYVYQLVQMDVKVVI